MESVIEAHVKFLGGQVVCLFFLILDAFCLFLVVLFFVIFNTTFAFYKILKGFNRFPAKTLTQKTGFQITVKTNL